MFNKQDILTVLNNQMGRRNLAQGTDDDLLRYCQFAYDYAWRYYRWTFSLKVADIAADGLLPTDFDLEGYRKFDGVTEITAEDGLTSTSGSYLEYDTALERYKLVPASAARIVYQAKPPTINDDTKVPFPAIDTLVMGALIRAKRGENPASVDTKQEWDAFHAELDRLVARAEANKVRSAPRNRHSVTGTFTGNVG